MIVNKISKTKYDFEEKHEKEQKTLLKIVNENKTLVQKIRLNWTENKLKKNSKNLCYTNKRNFLRVWNLWNKFEVC